MKPFTGCFNKKFSCAENFYRSATPSARVFHMRIFLKPAAIVENPSRLSCEFFIGSFSNFSAFDTQPRVRNGEQSLNFDGLQSFFADAELS